METLDAGECLSRPTNSRNHSCYNIMIIKANSPSASGIFARVTSSGACLSLSEGGSKLVGVRPKSARATT